MLSHVIAALKAVRDFILHAEPVAAAGVLVALADVLASSPDWSAVVPLIVAAIVRHFVSPVPAPE